MQGIAPKIAREQSHVQRIIDFCTRLQVLFYQSV
jgi:hypothetical protein